jgi:hypothetical protein
VDAKGVLLAGGHRLAALQVELVENEKRVNYTCDQIERLLHHNHN